MTAWTPIQLATFRRTVLRNPWMKHNPCEPKRNQKQIDFLMAYDVPEVLYGGAVGGGKSEALLMAALQYVEVPGYAALLMRRTFADLAKAGALMDRAHQFLANTAARWNGSEHVWTFPSGATLSFGYLDTDKDRFNYLSSEFQYIGFDELTQFKERDYRFLFSRLRRTVDQRVPLRMRAGTNPGGEGHQWVKKRFHVDHPDRNPPNRKFIRALLDDNPYLDAAEYDAISLSQLDSQTRKQYRTGDWTDFAGRHYRPESWSRYLDTGDAYRVSDGPGRYKHYLKADCSRLIALDWAMGKPKKDAQGTPMEDDEGRPVLDGDCTAFMVADMTDDEDGLLFLLDAVNERIPLGNNAPRLAELCRRWEPVVVAGDDDNLTEAMLLETRRYRDIPTIKTMPIRGRNKLTRSQSAIVRAERGKVYLPSREAPWVEVLTDQLAAFTGADGQPDDLADCTGILGRLADEFRPGEDVEEAEPLLGEAGYTGGGIW